MAARIARQCIGVLATAVLGLAAACEGDDGTVQRPDLPDRPECSTLVPAFTPCGGDLARTWRLEGVCAEGTPWALGPSGYCAGRAGTTDVVRTGILVVAADSLTANLSLDLEVAEFHAPSSCFDGNCADARVVDRWYTECVRDGDGCQCAGRPPTPLPAPAPRAIRLEGSDVVLVDDTGAEVARWPYCVDGDRAVIAVTEPPLPGLEPARVLWILGP